MIKETVPRKKNVNNDKVSQNDKTLAIGVP